MFGFIKNRFKFKSIVNMQFNQQIIFSAQEGGEYLFSDVYKQSPPLVEDFKVNFEFAADDSILKILFTIDNETYTLNINSETESYVYFLNFLEAMCCFKSWRTLVYVSSTDNVNDFFYVKNIESSKLRLVALLNVKGDVKKVDVCIDTQLFLKEFIIPFVNEISPFNEILQKAVELEKYSPEKVKLPL